MKKIIFILLLLLSFVFITGCNDELTDNNYQNDIDISSISFDDKTVVYDGNNHEILITNKPDNVVAVYVGNGVSEVGTYTIKVTLYDNQGNYIVELSAILTIIEGDGDADTPTNYKFDDATFVYNGDEHSIYVSNLPANYSATYEGNGVTEVGTYTVKAKVFDNEGNLVIELEAKINIVDKHDVELPLV